MGHFPAAEPHGHLGLVTSFQKLGQLAHLDVVVAYVGTRSKLDLLDGDLLLLALGVVPALAFVVEKFTVVHDPAHRRIGIG